MERKLSDCVAKIAANDRRSLVFLSLPFVPTKAVLWTIIRVSGMVEASGGRSLKKKTDRDSIYKSEEKCRSKKKKRKEKSKVFV